MPRHVKHTGGEGFGGQRGLVCADGLRDNRNDRDTHHDNSSADPQ
jgi:hypothetical protein